MTQIYSDIEACKMTTEVGRVEIYIIDRNGSKYRPNLILPNMLAVKKLRNYLNTVLKEVKK